ncbi:MAG: hypothetical protein R2726_10960 [Acidimicrobiales bacterium]
MAGELELTALRAELEEHRRTVADQGALIEQLEARLEQLEGRPTVGVPTTATSVGASGGSTDGDGRTDRRGLLRQAGVAVAGAAAGAVVLGQASPAAAAQGTFDGNPGVIGTASPAGGIGVRGDTGTGTGVLGRSQETSGTAIGVEGIVASNDGIGVRGNANSVVGETVGVLGRVVSASGYGVKGVNASTGSGNTTGVYGESFSDLGRGVVGRTEGDAAVGVLGISDKPAPGINTGYGVFGQGTGTGAVGVKGGCADGVALAGFSNRAQLQLEGTPAPPLGSGIARRAGEVVLDIDKVLWLCIAAGTPGTWRRLGGTGTAGALTLLPTPVRVYDSRAGNPPTTGPKTPIAGNTTRVLDTKNNSSGVPAGASGVLVTLTVVNGSANGGFLALFAAGSPIPSTSSINWSGAGQVVATTTVSAVDATAQVAVFCPPNSSTNLILDVIGYYQ